MYVDKSSKKLPKKLSQDFEGRDTTPLSADMLVKYQFIALIPTFATNFRFIVYNDGRLFYAINSSDENDPIFNTPLPDEPNRILPADNVAEIKTLLDTVDFFDLPAYLSEPARGGSMAIVTARRKDKIHEVWYENVADDLVNYLHIITPEVQPELTEEDEMAFLQSILDEQEREARAIEEMQEKTGEE